MTGRVGRWIATHPPCSTIARWVGGVRAEIAAGDAFRDFVDTSPSIFVEPPTHSELMRLQAICGGVSPSDLPRSS